MKPSFLNQNYILAIGRLLLIQTAIEEDLFAATSLLTPHQQTLHHRTRCYLQNEVLTPGTVFRVFRIPTPIYLIEAKFLIKEELSVRNKRKFGTFNHSGLGGDFSFITIIDDVKKFFGDFKDYRDSDLLLLGIWPFETIANSYRSVEETCRREVLVSSPLEKEQPASIFSLQKKLCRLYYCGQWLIKSEIFLCDIAKVPMMLRSPENFHRFDLSNTCSSDLCRLLLRSLSQVKGKN